MKTGGAQVIEMTDGVGTVISVMIGVDEGTEKQNYNRFFLNRIDKFKYKETYNLSFSIKVISESVYLQLRLLEYCSHKIFDKHKINRFQSRSYQRGSTWK